MAVQQKLFVNNSILVNLVPPPLSICAYASVASPYKSCGPPLGWSGPGLPCINSSNTPMHFIQYIVSLYLKSSPSISQDRPWGFQEVWSSQISRKLAHEGGKIVSPMHQPAIPPRKYSWYLFLLEAALNLGPKRKMKNSNDIIGNRTHDLPACSAVPQPTVP